MRKFLIILVAVLLFSAGVSMAEMPDKSCDNLALKKDMITLKNTDYDIQLDYYNMFDRCTGEVYDCRYGGPCENPTVILRSLSDGWPTNYNRYYIPKSGAIWGYHMQWGWRGGQKLEYTICGDGGARVYHSAHGWYGGNTKDICNTIN